MQRYLTYCLPALALPVGVGLAGVTLAQRVIALLLVAGLGVPTQLAQREVGGHGDDIRVAADILVAHEHSGDGVLYDCPTCHYPDMPREFAFGYPAAFDPLTDLSLARRPARRAPCAASKPTRPRCSGDSAASAGSGWSRPAAAACRFRWLTATCTWSRSTRPATSPSLSTGADPVMSVTHRRLRTSARMLTCVVLIVANALALWYFARSWAVYGNVGFGGYRLDLDVYRIGSTMWRHGGSLYGALPNTTRRHQPALHLSARRRDHLRAAEPDAVRRWPAC